MSSTAGKQIPRTFGLGYIGFSGFQDCRNVELLHSFL